MSPSQQAKEIEFEILHVLIFFLLSPGSHPCVENWQTCNMLWILTMILTFSHDLQFFPGVLVGLTPLAMCSRTWVSCYLSTLLTCQLELDSHQSNIFSCICNDLGPRCWILTHIHECISCSPFTVQQTRSFVFCHMSAFICSPCTFLPNLLSSFCILACHLAGICYVISLLSYSASYVREKTSIWL